MELEDPQKYAAAWAIVKEAQGIVVPGGFGRRGIEGMITAAHYCRTHRVPYLGICLGMQARGSQLCCCVIMQALQMTVVLHVFAPRLRMRACASYPVAVVSRNDLYAGSMHIIAK